jgi:hypothetical protein
MRDLADTALAEQLDRAVENLGTAAGHTPARLL